MDGPGDSPDENGPKYGSPREERRLLAKCRRLVKQRNQAAISQLLRHRPSGYFLLAGVLSPSYFPDAIELYKVRFD